jgi:integrase
MQETKNKNFSKLPDKYSSAKVKRYGIWQEKTARHGRCWRYDIRVRDAAGKTVRKTGSGFATKSECENAVAALRLASRETQYGLARQVVEKQTTINEAVEAYISMMIARWTAKYGTKYSERNSRQLDPVRRWVEFTGIGKPVKELTKQDFIIWTQLEIERGLQQESVQRQFNNIRAALNYAREIFDDLRNHELPRYSLGRNSFKSRQRILDEEEIHLLAEQLRANPKWRDAYDFFRIAMGCGGRFDEIIAVVIRKDMKTAGIKWSDINARQGILRLFSGKTNKERFIYVPAVIDILLERKKEKLGDAVHAFKCRDHFIRKIFAEASELCGITYGQQVANGWTVHDLRHTCLTNLLTSGVDLATVRDFAGHASIAETSKYVHPTSKSKSILAAAAENLLQIAKG